jgi:hypothetical protein
VLLDALSDLLSTVSALVINIPVDNAFGAAYVVLQNVFLLFFTLMGFSGTGGSIFPSF